VSFLPPTSISVTRVLLPYAQAIERDAGGEVKIEAFWGGALGRDPFKQYGLLTERIFEIGAVPVSLPITAVTEALSHGVERPERQGQRSVRQARRRSLLARGRQGL